MESTSEQHSSSIPTQKRVPLSTLAFDYKIKKEGLNQYFNHYIDSVFQESWSYPEEGVKAFLTRMNTGTVELQDKRLLINLPIQIDLDKSTLLGKWSAYGELVLTIISDIDISSDWSINTTTDIVHYEWKDAPKVKMGVLDIPIKSLANLISSRIKPSIEESIDEAVKVNFDLKEQALLLLNPILLPYQLHQSVGGWIVMSADSIHFSPWVNEENYVSGKIYAAFKTKVISNEPTIRFIELPPFTWNSGIGSISTFKVFGDLSYDYLTELARSSFINKSYKSGTRVIKVEDLNIYGQKDLIGVNLKTSGSFKGLITIEGTPNYDSGILSASNLRWSIKTKNILHKAAAWMKKGYIHEQLEKTLNFDLYKYVNTAQTEVYNNLAQIKRDTDVDLNLHWGHHELTNLSSDDRGINILMKLSVQIRATIDKLPKGL